MANQMPQQRAPGQAAPAALPTMLAKQKGATPPPQIGQLSQMPVEQLKQLFMQTMQGGTDVQPIAILAAIKSASERQRMQQALMGQMAQQQAAQQPGTVRDEVLAQAQPQGGIQALASGGPVQSFADGTDADGLMSRLPEDSLLRILGRWGTNIGAIERRLAEEASRARGVPATPVDQNRPTPQALERAVAPAPAGVAALPAAPARVAAAPAGRAAPAAAAPARAAAAPTAAARGTGIEAVLQSMLEDNPRLKEIEAQMGADTRERLAMLERMQGVSPETAAARKQYEETLRGLYAPQRKAAEEARAATKQGLFGNAEALARIASALGDPSVKTFGQGLARAAGTAGEVMGERRKRAEQLENTYQTLQTQINMTLAQARLADATGDEKRKQELLLQAQALKDRLTTVQLDMFRAGEEIKGRGIEGLTRLRGVKAQEAQANRPTEFQQRLELYRRDPNAYEAMFGSKEAAQLARVQQVVASDPKLKALANSVMPGAQEQYAAHYRSLIAMLAPELLVGAASTEGGATADALKIVRGGGQ